MLLPPARFYTECPQRLHFNFWQCSCDGIGFFTGGSGGIFSSRGYVGAVLTAFPALATSVRALAGAAAGAAAGAGPKYR